MGARATTIELQVGLDPSADAEDVAEATGRLRQELLELDVDEVASVPGPPPPPGTRAVDPVSLGGLLVTISASPVVVAILDTVRSWLSADRERSVTMRVGDEELVISGASDEQQREIVEAFLARHVRDD